MNREIFLKILRDDLDSEHADMKLYQDFIQILVPHVGKQITRRTKLPEGVKLVDGTYTSDKQGLLFENHGNKTFHIRKNKGETISLYNVHNYNTPYSQGTPQRIKKLNEILTDPLKLATILSTFEQLSIKWDQVKELFGSMRDNRIGSYHVPPYYGMMRAAGIPDNVRTHWDDKVE